MDDKDRNAKADAIENLSKSIREDRDNLYEIDNLRAKIGALQSGSYFMINETLRLPYKYSAKGLDTAIAEYRKDLKASIEDKIKQLKTI